MLNKSDETLLENFGESKKEKRKPLKLKSVKWYTENELGQAQLLKKWWQ